MNLNYSATLVEATNRIAKVTAIAFSPNGMRMACATTPDNHISLFDEAGTKKEKFVSKRPGEKELKPYCITSLCFSPDSLKLVVAQSDEIVLVYRVGAQWGDKKAICNKFILESGCTRVVWGNKSDSVLFGCFDGRVCEGKLRKGLCETLYVIHGNPVLSMETATDKTHVVVGHYDGSIVLLVAIGSSFEKRPLVKHSCSPSALAFADNTNFIKANTSGNKVIFAAGNDKRILVYSLEGQILQKFSYENNDSEKEYTFALSSPNGNSVVIAAFQRLRIFSKNFSRNQWEESQCVNIPNIYSITSLAFNKEGSKLALGSLCGAVGLFNASVKKYIYKSRFEINYVSLSQVMITRLSDKKTFTLETKLRIEINRISIHRDRFVVGFTNASLLCGDFMSKRKSEIAWHNYGDEKFIFDTFDALMVFRAGELTIIEYNEESDIPSDANVLSEPLAIIRTQFVSPYLISLRMSQTKEVFNGQEIVSSTKKAAYLLDLQTIRIDDLESGNQIATITHTRKINWVSFDQHAQRLLFRDRNRTLTMYDLTTHKRTTLSSFCVFCAFVQGSDGAFVAQNKDSLCVWYSIENPENMSMIPIKGDVIDVVKKNGRTEVLVDTGVSQESIPLNDNLIAFGVAMKDRDLIKAVSILETMEYTQETSSMWTTLAQRALSERKLSVAQRCFTAIGDIAKADYLRKIIRLIRKGIPESSAYTEELIENTNSVEIEARLDILDRQFKKAEYHYLTNGMVDDAINMYLSVLKSEEAYSLAISKNSFSANDIRLFYTKHLEQHKLYEKLATMREREGDFVSAIQLYLDGGLPSKAAVLANERHTEIDTEILRNIARKLEESALFEQAGDFYVRIEEIELAMKAYENGNIFQPLVELCRTANSEKVLEYERKWGVHLERSQQYESAIAHYLECYAYADAMRCAVKGKQWSTAIHIADSLGSFMNAEKGDTEDEIRTKQIEYYKVIAKHFEEVGNVEEAEHFYAKANLFGESIRMYLEHNMWEKAHSVAAENLSESDLLRLHITQASFLEKKGRFREAEKMLLQVDEVDLAINMYKKNRRFDDMLRLVAQFRKEHLAETNQALAEQLEDEGNLKLAEKYYVSSGNWKTAVGMYRTKELWEDAMRVARQNGNVKAASQVCWVYAKTLGSESGTTVLLKHGFAESAVRMCLDNHNFVKAETIAKEHCAQKLNEVFLNHAVYLEEQKKYTEAEEEFVRANQPKEAVLMYANIRDWVSAFRVAQSHCPEAMDDVFEQQAIAAQESGDYGRAEQLFVKAKRPQLAMEMYTRVNKHEDVERIKREFMFGGNAKEFDSAAQNTNKSIEYVLRRAEHDPQFFTEAMKIAHEQNIPALKFEELLNFVGHKLRELGRFDQIASILLNYTDRTKEAIEALVSGGLFKEAYEVAQTKQTSAIPSIKKAHMQFAASKRQWDICLEIASKESTEISAKYAAECVREYIQKELLAEACTVFIKYGIVPVPSNVTIYHTLAQKVFSTPFNSEIDESKEIANESKRQISIPSEPSLLREVYFRLMADMSSQKADFDQNTVEDFEKLRFIVHLFNQYYECTKHRLLAQRAKVATALLRYYGAIPADKAYYIAGMAQRDNNGKLAFVFLNRFLDVAEAIGEETSIPNDGFEETDLAEVLTIPQSAYLPMEKHEEIRNWLLQQVSEGDSDSARDLPTRKCDQCAEQIFEGSLWCNNCKHTHEACVVTGYPILSSQKVQCRACGKKANRDDWNKFVGERKICPWCNDLQGPFWK